MSNMSYCRFENTARDMRECLNYLESWGEEPLSYSEFSYYEEMLGICKGILQANEPEVEQNDE